MAAPPNHILIHVVIVVFVIVAGTNYIDIIAQLPLWKLAIEYNEWFVGAAISIHKLVPQVSVSDIVGSVLACRTYKMATKTPRLWLESLFACTFLQFGGTTITGILLGQTPSWIISNNAFPALFLVWLLTFYSPFDLYWVLFNSTPFLLDFFEICASCSAAHAVTTLGADKALFNIFHNSSFKYQNSVLTVLACGTFSACGGGLIGDWFGFFRPQSFTINMTPAVFIISNPSLFVIRARCTITRSFIMALLYYGITNPCGYFPWDFKLVKEDGHLVIFILQFINVILCKISSKFDLYFYICETTSFVITPAAVASLDDPSPVKKKEGTNKRNVTKENLKSKGENVGQETILPSAENNSRSILTRRKSSTSSSNDAKDVDKSASSLTSNGSNSSNRKPKVEGKSKSKS